VCGGRQDVTSKRYSLGNTQHKGIQEEWRCKQLHTLLTSALDGSKRSASRCGHFTPGERASVSNLTEGSIGLHTHYGCFGEQENYLPLLEFKSPNLPARTVITMSTELTQRHEVTGDWKKPQNEELHDWYC
jgi:hypothetical protein